MSALYTASTGSGKVTITEQNVILDAPGGRKSETVNRASITNIESKKTTPSLLGIGGGSEITLHTSDGRRLHIRLIKRHDAEAMLALLR